MSDYSVRDGLSDKLTTLGGVTLGGATYANGVGFGVPQNHNEWMTFGFSMAIAIIGAFMKRPKSLA